MTKAADKLAIPPHWTFHSKDVAAHFDAHVRESLPWYDLATGIVAHVARHYVPDRGYVLDVGCSTGNVGRAIQPILEARCARLIAIDSSQEMVDAYRGPGAALVGDVRDLSHLDACLNVEGADFIVCFLSLMFVPVRDRSAAIKDMRAMLRVGGALLVVDKMAPRPGYMGVMLHRLALAAKHEAGASADEVIAKELSLAGVQRPLDERELPREDGWVEVFRFGDFAGFIFEKPCT